MVILMVNKKLIIVSLTIIILLIQSANAFTIKTNNNEKNETLQQTGCIYGKVGKERSGYIPRPNIPFASVDAGIKKVRCNIKGDYWILELPLDQTYSVTASAYHYFPQTKIVTLTETWPSRCVNFYLEKDYDSIEKDQIEEIRILNNFLYQLVKNLQGL